jgi:hypothetical protein
MYLPNDAWMTPRNWPQRLLQISAAKVQLLTPKFELTIAIPCRLGIQTTHAGQPSIFHCTIELVDQPSLGMMQLLERNSHRLSAFEFHCHASQEKDGGNVFST